MVDNVTRGTPNVVSQGDNRTYTTGNFGATRREGVPVEFTKARWNLSSRRAESEAKYATLETNGGAHAQVGKLIKISGSVSRDLKVRFRVNYQGWWNVLGLGSTNMTFQSLVVRDSGPLFPSVGSSAILARRVHYDVDGSAYTNGSVDQSRDHTLTINSSDLSNGNVLRLVVACTTIGDATTFGSAESDAHGSPNQIDYDDIQISWS